MPDQENEQTREEYLEDLYEPCTSKEELRHHIKGFLNINLPDDTVDEQSNSNAMDFVWRIYYSMMTGTGATRVVVAASRNTAKTLTACIIRFYAMIHFRRSGTHLAAVQSQSDSATAYLNKMLHIDGVHEFLAVDNTRHKKLSKLPPNSYTRNDECELRIAVATMSGVNSQRGSLNIKDEVDLIPSAILTEASFISDPTRDEHQFDPIEIYLSSRKTNSGPIQKMLDEAEKDDNPRLAVYKWSWADWMRKCPDHIAKTDFRIKSWMHSETLQVVWNEQEFEFISDSERQLYHEVNCFEGCKSCPAFIACHGRAVKQKSTSRMLRSVSFIADRIKDAGDASAIIAQGLNWKPESSAVVFRLFNKRFHFLKAIEFYKWCIGSYYSPNGMSQEDIEFVIKGGDPVDIASLSPSKLDIYMALRVAGWRIHYGVDWGTNDPAVCLVVGYHKPTRRMVILHTSAMTGYPNEDWAKYIHANIWPTFPCDLTCPDMADINSPVYFGRLPTPIPCHDKKPARIEPGVSQIRSFLWNPATQQSHFAMLNDGDMGMNKWVAECFMKWTYKKTVTGYDFKHFEDNEYTHPLDSLRYAADPWIADMRVSMTAAQPRNEAQTEIAARLGDKEAYTVRKQKEELKQQIVEYFGAEHGLAHVFDHEEKMKNLDLPVDQQRGWSQLSVDKNAFIPEEKDPNIAEPLTAKPKGRIRFRF